MGWWGRATPITYADDLRRDHCVTTLRSCPPRTKLDEAKHRHDIRVHVLDFVGVEAVWDFPTVTHEDKRKDYVEERLVTIGPLNGEAVVLVYVGRNHDIHIVYLRRAER